MKKRIRFCIYGIVLVVVILLTFCFWDTIQIYAAPKVVLSQVLSDTLRQLDERFQYNPIRNCLEYFDPKGRYLTTVTLETNIKHIGPVTCDLEVQTDASANQAQIDGTVHSDNSDLNLSLYLNKQFVAMASQELLNGKFYGITYDTFLTDMEQFPLAKLLIPEATITQWNSSLQSIQRFMSKPYQIPSVSTEDIRMLMAGILLMDATVNTANIDDTNCFQITYAASGEEVRQLLSYVLDTDSSHTASITASFYLYEKKLLRIDITAIAGNNKLHCILHFGKECKTNDLYLTLDRTENGENFEEYISVSTASSDTLYQETVIFSGDLNHKAVYSWSPQNGDMTLSWDNTMPIRLKLTNSDEGIHVVTEDFTQLFGLLTGETMKTGREVAAVMTLKPGQALDAPYYTNLDQWSYEDFLTLLKGLTGLLGLSVK